MSENTNDSANPVLTFEGKKYLINELSNEIKESINNSQLQFDVKDLLKERIINHFNGVFYKAGEDGNLKDISPSGSLVEK